MRGRSRRMPWYSKPRVILAWTIPVAFVGIIAGKAFNADAEIDATIAGGLLAILGAIVSGILNNVVRNKETDDEEEVTLTERLEEDDDY